MHRRVKHDKREFVEIFARAAQKDSTLLFIAAAETRQQNHNATELANLSEYFEGLFHLSLSPEFIKITESLNISLNFITTLKSQ